MCRAVLVLVALSLIPTRASAEVFVAHEGVLAFSLSRSRVTTPLDAELKITHRSVWAQSGIKRVSRAGSFDRREVTVLNEPYELKDRKGGTWKLWIRHASAKGVVVVELIRAQPRVFPVQVFEIASVNVLGEDTEPSLPRLTLYPDGRYRLGPHAGRYERDEGGVLLDGVAEHWGRGAYTVDSEGLVFRFRRGPLIYEVRYQEVEDADEEELDEFMART